MAQAAKAALRSDNLDVVADRGYFKGEEILACEQAGVAVTLPKPQTSGAKSAGRFGKPDFVCLAEDDVYRCPAGEKLAHHFTADEDGQKTGRVSSTRHLSANRKVASALRSNVAVERGREVAGRLWNAGEGGLVDGAT
jgi:hypothetical protein